MQSKPVLVFVPGLAADGSVYAPFLRALREDFDVRSADHPLTLPDGDLTWNFFFDPIDRALQGTPGYLVGHSMGGAIALKYAADHPRRVRKVIAVAPILFSFKRNRHRVRESLRNAMLAIRGWNLPHAIRAFRAIRRRAFGGRGRKLYDFAHTIDLSDDLPRLRDATVLFPKREEVVPQGHADRVSARHPNVAVKQVPGSHHNIALSPQRLVDIVRKELDG